VRRLKRHIYLKLPFFPKKLWYAAAGKEREQSGLPAQVPNHERAIPNVLPDVRHTMHNIS